MTLPASFHIGWKNDLAELTLSSSPSANSTHPLSNIHNSIKGKPARWNFSSATALVLTGTSEQIRVATGLILKGHNLALDATVRLRLYEEPEQAGAVVYDSDNTDGAGAIYTQQSWGEMISGIDPWGEYYDNLSRLDRVYSLCFASVPYKSFRIDISVPSPVNNIVEIDKAALFFAWAPPGGFERGNRVSIVDTGEHTDTRAGGIRTTPGLARRRMEISFAYMAEMPQNVMMSILDRAGKQGDLYIIADPYLTGFSKYLTTSIYKRNDDASYQTIFHNGNNISLTLREN
jgi:hypothetical protein